MGLFIASLLGTVDGFDGNPHFEPTPDAHQAFNDLFASTGGMVCDRANYQILLPYWDELDLSDPAVNDVEREFAVLFRRMPRYVVDADLDLDDPLATAIAGDPIAQLRDLKAGMDRSLLVAAGPDLLAILLDHDLIDEVEILILPIVVGDGARQIGTLARKRPLDLLGSRALPSGAMVLRYRVTGPDS